jgi:hypothetical protein
MIKFIVATLLTALFAFALGMYAPWWSIALCACIVGAVVPQKNAKAFLAGLLGIMLLWIIVAVVKDGANNHILSSRIANLLPLKGSVGLLVFVTGLIGGLVGGLSALCGSMLRGLISKKTVVEEVNTIPEFVEELNGN